METHKKLIKLTPLLSIKPTPKTQKNPTKPKPPLLIKPSPENLERPNQTQTTIANQAGNTQPHGNL